MNDIHAVLFDFFNVVHVDPYEKWLHQNGLEIEGIYVELADNMSAGRMSTDEFFLELSKLQGQSPETIKSSFSSDGSIDLKMVDLIESIHKKYKTGLLSNANHGFLRPLLADHQLERLFDEIVISSEVGHVKPSVEIFEHALKVLDVKPANLIFIDDLERNTNVAGKLGIRTITYKGNISELIEQLKDFKVTI
ncbi:MAG: HAD family hydrolase [Candidatus Saccharimonadales bacterium]